MGRRIFILALALAVLSCGKKIELKEPGEEWVCGPENLREQYQALARAPVSAQFLAVSNQGNFQGQIYLNPAPEPSALIYAYSSLGQSLFQTEFSGRSFLYLNFPQRSAYSNQKNWLTNYQAIEIADPQTQVIIFLQEVLIALAGNLREKNNKLTLIRANQYGLSAELNDTVFSNTKINYYFSCPELKLQEIEILTNYLNIFFDFKYENRYWFPKTINIKTENFWMQINLKKITCPEINPPQLSLTIPPGFAQLLIQIP